MNAAGTWYYGFNGMIDEVRLYNTTISTSQIFSLYEQGLNRLGVNTINTKTDSTTKAEGSASQRTSIGAPLIDNKTIALWHLDETGGTGAYIKDTSGNGNNGTPTGTSSVDGISGKARNFNGSSDYIDLGTSSMTSGTTTIETWIKSSTYNDGMIADLFVGGVGMTFSIYQNRIISSFRGYVQPWTSAGLLIPNAWNHVAVVYDGGDKNSANSRKIYINGISQSLTLQGTNCGGATNRNLIGKDSNSGAFFLNGQVDEIKISNTARTADEIAEAYRLGRDHRLTRTLAPNQDLSSMTKLPYYIASDKTGTFLESTIGESAFANNEADANTLGLWHLEEATGSGAYLKDSSSYGNNGTPTVKTIFDGKIGKAVYGATINMNNESNFRFERTQPFSISGWIKIATLSSGRGYQNIFSKMLGSSPYTGYHLTVADGSDSTVTGAGILRFGLINTWTTNTLLIQTNDRVDDNQWHYVVASYDGSSSASGAKIYIDGAQVPTTTKYNSLTASIANSSASPYISTSSYGGVDEVRIDNIARTPDEIRQAYEINKRTHTVTIDFAASLDSGDLITNDTDKNFTVDATKKGLSQKGSYLYVGDKVIVKENYNGIEYIAQGVVNSITASTGVVSVSSWDVGSTFPSGGFTANSDVFKWQREYWDLTGIMDDQIDAANRITIRLTNGSEGRNIWLDDFEIVSSYLTNPTGSTINSTPHRYLQYRSILSTTDTTVMPSLSEVDINVSDTGNFSTATNRLETINEVTQLANKSITSNSATALLLHMDEASGSTLTDVSGNNLNGTATGTTIVDGKIGKARSFNGTSDYVSMGTTFFNNPTKGSISLWLKPTANGVANGGQLYYNTAFLDKGNIYISFQQLSTNKIRIYYYDSGTNQRYFDSNTALSLNNWNHFVYTWDASGSKIYINGIEDITSTYTIANVHSGHLNSAFEIGRLGDNSRYFSGLIDEIKFSNQILSPEEIAADAKLYKYGVYTSPTIDTGGTNPSLGSLTWIENGVRTGNGETPKDPTGLVAQWNFNETNGTTATNNAGSCGSACNGTLTNMTTTGQDASVNSGWTANNKKWGAGALMFDGSDDYVVIPSNSALDLTNKLSLEFWFRPKAFNTNTNMLLTKQGASGNGDSPYRVNFSSNSICFGMTNSAGVWTYYCPSTNVTLNQWHHLVVTYNGSNNLSNMYFDGKYIGQKTDCASSLRTSVESIKLGAEFWNGFIGGYQLIGAMDSFRIYNRDLSADEALSNYQAGNIEFQTRTGTTASADDGTWEEWKPSGSGVETTLDNIDQTYLYNTTDSGLLSYYPMDETSGTTINDRKGTNNGTATGTKIVDAKFGKARSFNGTSDNIFIPHSTDLNFERNNTFSISTWFKSNTGNYENLASKTDSAYKGWTLMKLASSDPNRPNSMCLILTNTNASNDLLACTPSNSLVTGNVYHIVSTYNGNSDVSGVKIYINGISQTVTAIRNILSGSIQNTSPTLIGKHAYAGGNYFLNGWLDEMRIYNTEISPTLVQRQYDEGINRLGLNNINSKTDTTIKTEGTASQKTSFGSPLVDDNTVTLWHMEETGGTGAYIKDSSGNNNHGTPTGTSITDGIFGKARSFNGTSDYIQNVLPTRNIYSFDFWFKSDNDITPSTSCTVPLTLKDGGTGVYYFLALGSCTSDMTNETINISHNSTGRSGVVGITIPGKIWHHVAASWNGSNYVIYLDGVAQTTSAGANGHSALLTNPNYLVLGAERYNNGLYTIFYPGKIDEFRISSIARTSEEIAEIYRAGANHRITRTLAVNHDLSNNSKITFSVASDRPGTYLQTTFGESAFANYEADANTVGLWHLEEATGSGAYLKDSSSYANNGTPTGTSLVDGKVGKGRSLSSASDYISPNIPSNMISNYSYSMWVQLRSNASPAGFLGQTSCNASGSLEFLSEPNVTPIRVGFGRCNQLSTSYGAGGISLNQWYHLAFVVSPSKQINIYINGQNTGTFDGSSLDLAIKPGATIGGYRTLNGIVDEIRLDSVARTTEEIRQAYEVGKRTHGTTIDFGAKLDSGDLITNANDKDFKVNAVARGLSAKAAGLFAGDKIIVRENYDGTEYIAQGTVNYVDANTGIVSVTAWDAGSTFPSAGYTINADAFKWQKEYFDLGTIDTRDRDAINQISIRLSDGIEGRNIWLDDFKTVSNYLTDPAGSTINSTPHQFLQYRAIVTGDSETIPSFSDVNIDYEASSGITMGGASTTETYLSEGNKDNFNLSCSGLNYSGSQLAYCQGSWNQTDWNNIGSLAGPLTDQTIAAQADLSGWAGYPSGDGEQTIYMRAMADTATSTIKTVTITKDTVAPNPTLISITGDTTSIYYDTTNDNSTIIAISNQGDASGCRWSESDQSYNAMVNNCASSTSCTSTLPGEGVHTVYIRCIDNAGNAMTSSLTATYTIDSLPPTTPPTCSPADNTFFNPDLGVACTTGVGGDLIRYTSNGSSPNASSDIWSDATIAATADFKLISCDNANNCFNTFSEYHYTLDNVAPSVPTMNNEPTYTAGTSNAVSSGTVTDGGVGGVEYEFCADTSRINNIKALD